MKARARPAPSLTLHLCISIFVSLSRDSGSSFHSAGRTLLPSSPLLMLRGSQIREALTRSCSGWPVSPSSPVGSPPPGSEDAISAGRTGFRSKVWAPGARSQGKEPEGTHTHIHIHACIQTYLFMWKTTSSCQHPWFKSRTRGPSFAPVCSCDFCPQQ